MANTNTAKMSSSNPVTPEKEGLKYQMQKNKPNRPTVACYVTHNYTTSYNRTSYYIMSVPKKVTF